MKRERGRPKLNTSETKQRTYKISETQLEEFKEWCKIRGLKLSVVIRGAMVHLMKEENDVLDLLEDPWLQRFAERLLEEQKKKQKGVY